MLAKPIPEMKAEKNLIEQIYNYADQLKGDVEIVYLRRL